jgi:membrane protein required for colicin V production
MEYLSTLKLTTVDYFTLVVLLVSALVGISRGLFKEVLALASWFVASWVAYHYTNYLSVEWLSTFHMDGRELSDFIYFDFDCLWFGW